MEGFEALDNLVARVKSGTTKGKLDKYVGSALRANKEDIANFNKEQLSRGEDSEDGDLGTYHDFNYKNRWKPVDLKLTGDFHNSIKPKFGSNSFEMTSNDSKAEMLQDKYGDSILGLSTEDIQEVGLDIVGQVQYGLKNEIL
ncbi:hypothetical protein BWD42_04065 [Sphingobacterium sp. CZ-UAM]|uniref:hypothetical protein n=1 Tax=Sphingobacterium sp. CZ-UAM TaxID=1933868 RepID=UPI0009847084|nr:hypothetical protein [Sphingobacterium sp. CZ-UAM]OOG19133.1 hypothetical protein BWD42_04065 [Sphingobacterium sp. CZ-UAM]